MRKLYDLEKEKICWKPWMISGVGIWTGLVAMGLLLFAVACSEGTGGGQSSEDLILFSWEGQIALLSALDFACGSIFAAALASRVVVRDYGKDYASVLLLYPMNRKRMFRAKELLISLRTVLLCLPALLIATGILAFVAAVDHTQLDKLRQKRLGGLGSRAVHPSIGGAAGNIRGRCGDTNTLSS